ncbi:MAG TPA: hypothetical protein VNR39_06985 [Pseudolabrys sp.]|nr:hypothetical protein [Pseudolabrys sp.]
MTTLNTFTAASRSDMDRVVREARAARAEAIRAGAHNFATAIKRLFSALRPQAAH